MIPAGWWPAAPALAMHCSIRSRSLHQSRRRACSSPLVCSILTKEPRQTNCRVLSAATSSTPSPLSNPHSARGTASALPPGAISCLGAFRTPAAAARGKRRHAGVRKPCMGRLLSRLIFNISLFDRLLAISSSRPHFDWPPRAVTVKGGRRPSRSDLPLTVTSMAAG
jgi:hypothetical protein